MKKTLKKINHIIAQPFIWVIKIYQYTLSPDKGLPSLRLRGRVCAHHPHCSQYSINVFKRYGFLRGFWYSLDRVLHCTPSMNINYDPDHYRVVFFSSAPIGVPFLQELVNDKRFEVVGIVSQPDKPSGRGLEIHENIIKTEGKKLGIHDIITPEKINPEKSDEGKEFLHRLDKKQADFLVVIAYGKIIPQSILDAAKIAPINVHGSLLPEYRGASPIQSVFLDGKSKSGITIMKMDKGMDTGDIINVLETKLAFERTCKDLIEWMKIHGPKFLNSMLWKFGKKILGHRAQDEKKATYCSKIEKESGLIDIQKDPLELVYSKYRGFFLWPKIYFIFDGKRVIVEELVLDEKLFAKNSQLPLVNQDFSLNLAVVNCVVKPEGKKVMGWEEFKRGYVK